MFQHSAAPDRQQLATGSRSLHLPQHRFDSSAISRLSHALLLRMSI
ncbi:hypothetical protein [Proteus penneri]